MNGSLTVTRSVFYAINKVAQAASQQNKSAKDKFGRLEKTELTGFEGRQLRFLGGLKRAPWG